MSLSLTHGVLLSEVPDSLETVSTSFPVTPFLPTLTSQVREYIWVHANQCVYKKMDDVSVCMDLYCI